MARVILKFREWLFSRVVIVGLLIIVQVAMLAVVVLRLSRYFAIFYGIFMLLSVVMTLVVINKEENPSYKLAWIIPIMAFPLFGGFFYLMFGNPRLSRRLSERLGKVHNRFAELVPPSRSACARAAELGEGLRNQSEYITRMGFPPFARTETTYLSPGEEKYKAMLKVLENAKRYIFLEYFIIEEGQMWDSILKILERKVKEGVEVRVLYDGFGCLLTLPDDYFRTLREKGIQCIEFNPLIPVLTMFMNNRDHRKILVVDGHTGFMGGINLADEYINAKVKHGHWKDAAVMLRGDAVWSLATMFLTMWDSISDEELSDPERYRPLPEELPGSFSGIVQPYADSPLDRDLVGEMVYLNIINRAQRYLYICTPYLIVDNETLTALLLAAKSGVDVRIITPHIGDKWYVHLLTRACYPQLVRGGVKIYEYTPGFIHSKTFVSDDEVATVGTINLDYRSLYLHFECGLWMAHSSCISAVRDDFLETLRVCEQVTLDRSVPQAERFERLLRAVLRIFAPLM